MRLSPRLLSLVAGTATVASLAPLAGCMESRAAAEPVPVVAAPSAPVRGNWGAPVSPVVMRPIDFEAPPPAQVHVDLAPAAPEPIVVSVAPEAVAVDEVDDADEAEAPRTARRPRNRDRGSPSPDQPTTPPDVISIAPDWEMAAACGRG